jgi:hypothetical protein
MTKIVSPPKKGMLLPFLFLPQAFTLPAYHTGDERTRKNELNTLSKAANNFCISSLLSVYTCLWIKIGYLSLLSVSGISLWAIFIRLSDCALRIRTAFIDNLLPFPNSF